MRQSLIAFNFILGRSTIFVLPAVALYSSLLRRTLQLFDRLQILILEQRINMPIFIEGAQVSDTTNADSTT